MQHWPPVVFKEHDSNPQKKGTIQKKNNNNNNNNNANSKFTYVEDQQLFHHIKNKAGYIWI